MIRPLLAAALLVAPLPALADPPAGQIDPTFGEFDGGVLGLQLEGFDLGGDFEDRAYAMTEDAQGRLLLAGVGETDGGYCLGLMRFTSEGQLDTADFGFNQNNVAQGKICHPILAPDVHLGFDLDIALLSDGGFLVGGIANVQTPFICRFHADGRQRLDFGAGTGCVTLAQIDVGGFFPAPDVLVSGASVLIVANHRPDDISTPALSRIDLGTGELQPFGQQDFVPLLSSDADASAWDALLTDDGAVMLVGYIFEDADDQDAFVARFDLQQNQPDLAFSGDGMVRFKFNKKPLGDDDLTAITALPNGNVLAAGMIVMPDRYGLATVELDAVTGALSPTFNNGLPKTYDPCSGLTGGCSEYLRVHEIGTTKDHVVIAGVADFAMFAARLDRDGNADSGFGNQGLARFEFSEEATGLVLQDERIVLSGVDYSGGDDFALLRLSDGRLFRDEFEAATP